MVVNPPIAPVNVGDSVTKTIVISDCWAVAVLVVVVLDENTAWVVVVEENTAWVVVVENTAWVVVSSKALVELVAKP
jgi:hypothetical protein